MANSEQLALLRSGISSWNQFRAESPTTPIDLQGASLSGPRKADLRGANFAEANLGGAMISGADLRGADLSGAELRGTFLNSADLQGASLSKADLRGADLGSSILIKTNLKGAVLQGARLWKADLQGANLQEVGLERASLEGANLQGADLQWANLQGSALQRANLQGANLQGANLHRTDLRRANLRGAELTKASLFRADLLGTDLSRANLSRADLQGAELRKTELRGADLTEAIVGYTIFAYVDLTTAVGIDTLWHSGPSTIGIETLFLSGNLPDVFLRGIGLPDHFINYLPSLMGQQQQFFNCLISYSPDDHEFANRLYTDLQVRGVRCWIAPMNTWDSPATGALRGSWADRDVQYHDQVIVILSKNSVPFDDGLGLASLALENDELMGNASIREWFGWEMATAFEEEGNRRRQRVICPLRIDDAVNQAVEDWAVRLRQGRRIHDFSDWKNSDSYQRSLEGVLQDLRRPPNWANQRRLPR